VRAHGRLELGALALEHRRDLLQREPEPAQREDPVEPGDLGRPVAAVAVAGALGGCEQADRVPVVQGANGEAARLREGADGVGGIVHAVTVDPDVT
jgi:hypothetical protein